MPETTEQEQLILSEHMARVRSANANLAAEHLKQEEQRAALDAKDAEIERLRARFEKAAATALAIAESYELAVERLVLSMEYMQPEQRRAFNAAWAEKRAELRALKA